jgi:hypothetical protein
MASFANRALRALLSLIVLSSALWCGSASARDTLGEVKVSPDLKRVIIKSSGQIADYNTFQLDRPPRLVIDVAGVSPGKLPKTLRPEQNGGLKIDLSESRSGTHVVLDFGGGAVPQHRIRRMDSYLIVFLDDWRPPVAASPSMASAHRTSKTVSPPVAAEKHESSTPGLSQWSDLIIESADVIDGLIVLKVADKMRPERPYRIGLGVNLQRRGFVYAEIDPWPVAVGPALSNESASIHSLEAMNGRPKVGPRKSAGPVAMGANQGRNETPSEGDLPTTTLRGTGFGPTRFPRRAGSIGPVSQGTVPRSPPDVVHRIPRMSVSEKARETLQAYRQAPLLRAETCAFEPLATSSRGSPPSSQRRNIP